MKAFFVFVAALFITSTAWAQSAQNPPAPTNGPLVLERIHDPWVLAPDFKVTDLDGRTGQLPGVYGGRLLDDTLLIGGAVYWLANDERDFKMTYGGVLVGWQSHEFGRIRFGGRGLTGFGRATLGVDTAPLQGITPLAPGGRGDIRFGVTDPRVPAPQLPAPTIRARFAATDDFFVVEPQANVSVRITNAIGVSCGASYRQTANANWLRDRLNGPSASLAVQFGF
ncbi:MAG TPA: hypothetical protein VFU28_26980 [Vicinamibacterales bacterium]|nr:hypothetical protein [Vicinamibacterales bacterium]